MAAQSISCSAYTGEVTTYGPALQTGQVHNYLASLPVVNAAWGLRVAYLTSLQELTILDSGQQEVQRRILIQTEPAFIGMGPGHVAVGMNNKARECPVG